MRGKNKILKRILAGLFFTVLIVSACSPCAEPSSSVNDQSFPGVFISYPLMCPRDLRAGPGPTWRNITVGQSTRYDLEEIYGVQAAKDTPVNQRDFSDTFSIHLTASAARKRQLSQSAMLCTVNGTITMLALEPIYDSELSSFLQDWIIELGQPAIVNWTPSGIGWRYRILVWPEQGIAMEVDAAQPDFPSVQIVVFFPFMETIDWDQWPLSGLVQDAPSTLNEGYPTQENPFNFDGMIAIMTAQPLIVPTAASTPE